MNRLVDRFMLSSLLLNVVWSVTLVFALKKNKEKNNKQILERSNVD